MSGVRALQLYRSLLRTSRLIRSAEESQQTELQVKSLFREHQHESDEGRINELLDQAQSRLRFLRVKTPRSAYQRKYKPHVRMVMQDGDLVEIDGSEGQGKDMAFYKDQSGIDPESLRRHHKLLRRQHFMDRPPIY